jgi:hypothetical protein
MTSARSEHLYVYAVVAGRPGARVMSGLPALPDGGAPRVLPLDDATSLIVADVSSATYNAESLETRLADLDWVARCGAAHHAVSDGLVTSHVLLPFRLFTIFSSEAKAIATLKKSKSRIAKALSRVKGRQEWVLRIGTPDPARMAPSEQPTVATESGTTFLQGKAAARRASAERAERTSAEAAVVFDALREIADDAAARPIEPGMNLLLDAAFLVAKRRTTALQKRLTETAGGLLNDGCAVSLTGPWPPYSFASLD